MQQEIVQLYNPVFQYVKKRISDPMDAEDVTQDVFYKLSVSKNSEVENIKSWLYAIAKNTIIDYYRKKKLHLEQHMDEILMEEPDTNSKVVDELIGCIEPFIEKLPEEYKTLMQLSELQDVPQKEIARQLDMNYVTVRSKVQRGRKKLKQVFTDCCTFIQGGRGSILGYENKYKCGDDCE